MNKHFAKYLTSLLLAAVFGVAAPVHAATTDLATQPMAISGSTSIKPNVLFLLDDSGSMAWDRLSPDTMAQTNSDTSLCYMNSTYNGVYYNPVTTYTLPVTSTGANYPNSTFTNAKDDGFDITSPTYSNLSTGFKTGGNSNNSISGPGAFYYTYHPTAVATITVSGGSSTTVSSITVHGVQLMSASASGSNTNSTEANNITNNITLNGFSATRSGSVITITGPMSAATYSPVITKSGSDTFAVTTFASDGTPTTPVTGTCYPDANYTRVDVTSASAEAQNFANWYSYYRTRMLTMKSAVGRAFKGIDSSFRVGFSRINSITGASPLDVNISDFDATQRATWYADFYAVVPNNSTPLRVALADAGRIFAHKLTGAADPMQYSCQQNFTIMTTDGMWNEATNPKQLNGSTDIGNQDNTAPRPMYDGSSYVKTTKQNQQNTSTIYQNTTQLQALQTQSGTSNLQQRTGALQWTTKQQQTIAPLQWQTKLQQATGTLQWQTKLQQTTAPLQWQTKSQQTVAPLQWQTKLQQTAAPLQWQTKLQQTTAPLMKSTATYTSTAYLLTISTTSGGSYSNAAKSTAYTCRTSGTGSGTNMYCKLSGSAITTPGLASCTVTANNPPGGASATTDSNRDVITACTQSGWSAATAVGNNGTCNASSTVQCSASSTSTNYVSTYPPSCTVNFNAAGSNTADGSGNVVTVCPTSGSWSTAAALGANKTCTGSSTINCPIGTGTTSYLASPTATCTATWTAATGTSTSDASGNVTTCSTSGTFSTAAALGANKTCTGSSTINCPIGTGTTSYLASPTATCSATWTAATGTSTSDASGNVVSACPTSATWSTAAAVGANASCPGNGTTVQCANTGTATYLTSPTAACTQTFNGAAASSTANASGNVTTCSTSGTFSTAAAIGANQTCTGSSTINCPVGTGTTSYLASPTATCSATWTAATGTSTADASGNVVTACPVNAAFNSTWTNVASGGTCTPGANANCQYNFGSWSNTSACTENLSSGAGVWNITSGTDCQYTAYSTYANVSSCTAVAQSAASPYTVGTATQCQNTWQGVNTCTAGTGGQTACQTVTGSTAAASCAPATASSGNNWTTTSCSTTTTPWVGVSSCTAAAASSSNGYAATNCNPSNPVTTTTTVTSCTASSATAANNWTTTTCSTLTGGTPNTLADVAYYYWTTDLRDSTLSNCTGVLGTDVCYNNVRGSGADVNSQQHMTTFTLGLGVVGTLNPDGYPTLSADYNNLVTGPNNWPAPVSNTNTTIDDLWHAAVNGRGVYFSAKNPDSLVTGLSQSLEGVKARQGASAAASTSNMQPVPGDSYAYVALFNTVSWDGDLLSKEIDPVTSTFVKDPVTGQDLIVWSAQALLDPLVSASSDTRTIYTFDSSVSAAANKLKTFTWSNLNATEQGYFSNICTSPYLLSQCPTLIANDTVNGTTTATAASGANLVNFLRGQHGFEDIVTNTSRIYRSRNHVLGDIVSAQPQYVRKPPFDYTDAGYADFKTAQVNRASMVYSGANDGMLHAFDGATGVEQWAYIPPMVMNNMYRLASEDYSTNHRYYVDGTPTVADICPKAPPATCSGSEWKSILVGGLNGGGRGYYALDITDPAHPKALWNYTVTDQANLGYTYGNPVVAKRKDNCTTVSGVTTCTGGTWVVAVTSGYNNVSPGDGQGHLFILNAYTGAQLEDIVTAAGSTTTPNGLAKINAWIKDPGDNTAERYYGGDLLGNVWRFDIDNQVAPLGKEAFLLAQLGYVDLATAQPITIKPELVEIVDGGGTSHAVVQVATGRYLGLSDLPNTDQQSVYSFKDNLTATGLGLVRTPGLLVKQTISTYTSGGNSYRKSTTNPVDWNTKSGWYEDLNPGNDSPGERVNIDMNMQQTILSVIGNVPDTNACNVGGYSWAYYFNYETGSLAPLAGIKDTANSLIAGTTQIQDATGKTHTIVTHTDGTVTIQDDVAPASVLGLSRRVSWRELTY